MIGIFEATEVFVKAIALLYLVLAAGSFIKFAFQRIPQPHSFNGWLNIYVYQWIWVRRVRMINTVSGEIVGYKWVFMPPFAGWDNQK
jgi:hypothetical protein